MYRKFYSYNNMPNIPVKPVCQEIKAEPKQQKTPLSGGFLEHLESDDIILGVVLLLLLMNDCDDKLLLLAIAFVFLSGFSDEKNR